MTNDDDPTPTLGAAAERGGRHEIVRRANVELVFQAIVDHAPVSRASLVSLTRLSKPTVLRLVAALEQESLIRRASPGLAVRRGAGRIPVVYEPNPDAAYVIGVDVGGTKLAGALADLAGNVRVGAEIPTPRSGAEALLVEVARLARRLADDFGVPWSRVAAVTVGTPGVENPDGTIRLADNIPGLGSVPLASRLQEMLETAVQVENDVNLAALGEMEEGAAQACDTFALLALGTGLGAALVIDGNLARGSRGAAGEVGYLPIGADPGSPEARRRGAFEVAAAGSGLTALLAAELQSGPGTPAGDDTPTGDDNPTGDGNLGLSAQSTARDIYEAAARGDDRARRAVERQAELVAHAVLTIGCLIDPELVVLGGGIGANPLLQEMLGASLERIMPWRVPVELSALGPRSGVIGAIHHARRSVPRLEAANVSARMQSLGRDPAP